MKNQSSIRTALVVVLLAAALSACSDTPTTSPEDPNGIQVPGAYAFDSRFSSGVSSVSYSGQIVRHLLIQDLSAAISALAKPGAGPITAAELLKYYEHSDADNLDSRTTVDGSPIREARYNKLATGKKLSDNISGAAVIGTDRKADALVREWIDRIAANSQDPARLGTSSVLLDENGVDMSQMINKVLLGAVAYYRGTTEYLQSIIARDNAVAADDGMGGKSPYTVMEHNWDEAFGYFGAARDYARYTDAQLSGTSADYSYDSNGDGVIDLLTEYNFAFARNAGKRDKAAGTDFSREVFDAFLRGRTAISNQGTNQALAEPIHTAARAWEKVIAASVVHYIRETLENMETLGTPQAQPGELSKVWSEGRGYLIALQFNALKVISDAQLAQLSQLYGDHPIFSNPGTSEYLQYRADLTSAIDVLKQAYGFTDAQINAW